MPFNWAEDVEDEPGSFVAQPSSFSDTSSSCSSSNASSPSTPTAPSPAPRPYTAKIAAPHPAWPSDDEIARLRWRLGIDFDDEDDDGYSFAQDLHRRRNFEKECSNERVLEVQAAKQKKVRMAGMSPLAPRGYAPPETSVVPPAMEVKRTVAVENATDQGDAHNTQCGAEESKACAFAPEHGRASGDISRGKSGSFEHDTQCSSQLAAAPSSSSPNHAAAMEYPPKEVPTPGGPSSRPRETPSEAQQALQRSRRQMLVQELVVQGSPDTGILDRMSREELLALIPELMQAQAAALHQGLRHAQEEAEIGRERLALRVRMLEESLVEGRAERDGAQNWLDVEIQRREDAEEEAERLREEVARLERERVAPEASFEVEELGRVQAAMSEQLQQEVRKREEAERKAAVLGRETAKLGGELQQVREEKERVEEQLKAIEDNAQKLKKIERTAKKAHARSESQSVELKRYKGYVEEKERELLEMQQQLDDAEGQVSELEHWNQTLRQQVERLQEQPESGPGFPWGMAGSPPTSSRCSCDKQKKRVRELEEALEEYRLRHEADHETIQRLQTHNGHLKRQGNLTYWDRRSAGKYGDRYTLERRNRYAQMAQDLATKRDAEAARSQASLDWRLQRFEQCLKRLVEEDQRMGAKLEQLRVDLVEDDLARTRRPVLTF